jgi:hypothetical protein
VPSDADDPGGATESKVWLIEGETDQQWAPAYAVDGPLGGSWVYTVHDPRAPLTVRGNEIDGEVVYAFTVEGGRPTLRVVDDGSADQGR